MHTERLVTVAVCAAITAAAAGQNTGARLTDGSAILDYTTSGVGSLPTVSNGSSGDVLMNFQLGGIPDDQAERQVFSGNWFYRVHGDDRERHLANASSRVPTGTNQVNWTFPQVFTGGASPIAIPDVSAEMGFNVYSTGPDSAYFYTYLCVINNGPTPIDVDLFFAVDIDLGGTFGGDIYDPLAVTPAGRTWTLTDGSNTGIMFGPGADAAGVGQFGSILGAMTNPVFNTFMGDLNPGGFGPGDLAAVMQWQETISPGAYVCVPTYVGIGRNGVIPTIPTPGAVALLALGGLAAARRRRD